MPAISTVALAKHYGERVAVVGLDLVVPRGQIVGLLGPNGAGKSTTLRMLMGMLRPTSGTAAVRGIDVVADPHNVKRIAGYVPESGALFDTLTGWEYLKFVAALYDLDDGLALDRIRRFATFFDLDPYGVLRERLSTYSKGMRQKVLISSALLHNPDVVFFDEPLDGLDANSAAGLKTLIVSLAREGKTIVYCSHVLDVVEKICERVVILHQGRIIADGTAPELCDRAGENSLERAFNRMTGTENLLERAQEFARSLSG
jgi:ABC-2 type transport system ATP-binding protein